MGITRQEKKKKKDNALTQCKGECDDYIMEINLNSNLDSLPITEAMYLRYTLHVC